MSSLQYGPFQLQLRALGLFFSVHSDVTDPGGHCQRKVEKR
jgi:hypothetical protein